MKNDPKKFDWNTVGLDFGNWEDEKLWALNIPSSKLDIKELEWHLDCPFWVHDMVRDIPLPQEKFCTEKMEQQKNKLWL